MNKKLQEPTVQVSARRRLVRGAFAAPAALSLYSGNVFAATSISNCVAKDVGANNFPPPVTTVSSTDTYIRIQLWELKQGNKGTTWVKGDNLAFWQAPPPANPPFLDSGKWLCVAKTSNDGSSYLVGAVEAVEPAFSGYTMGQTGLWAALKIDTNGNIVGVIVDNNNTNGQSAVHQSCWTSFRQM